MEDQSLKKYGKCSVSPTGYHQYFVNANSLIEVFDGKASKNSVYVCYYCHCIFWIFSEEE